MKKKGVSRPQQAIEKMGLIPRSILRTLDRFRMQLSPGIEKRVLREFQISRSQFLVSCRTFLLLFFFPIFVNHFSRNLIFHPSIEFFWNTQQSTIFLNTAQEKQAYRQIQDFEEKLYFESLVYPEPLCEEERCGDEQETVVFFQQKISQRYRDLALEYNEQSIQALTNVATDVTTVVTLGVLIRFIRPQIQILKSFLVELLYSFGDTTKSFLLLFFTDLLVGFHSPHGWEVFLGAFTDHFAIIQNEDFVFLFVATVPVLLDTVIKYWIFRYLNRISPSTVATYHTLIE